MTDIMMGLAGGITPQRTGTMLFTQSALCWNQSAGDTVATFIRYGTGGLMPGTTYWCDIELLVTTGSAGTAQLGNITLSATEIGQ